METSSFRISTSSPSNLLLISSSLLLTITFTLVATPPPALEDSVLTQSREDGSRGSEVEREGGEGVSVGRVGEEGSLMEAVVFCLFELTAD